MVLCVETIAAVFNLLFYVFCFIIIIIIIIFLSESVERQS